MDEYTKTYISLIEHARYVRALPWWLKCRIGSWFGRHRSFLLLRREQIVATMQSCLDCDRAAAEHHFGLLCESSGVAVQMVEELDNIPERWLKRHIQLTDTGRFQDIGRDGAVILSHHSYHHNLLISFFKLCGLPVYPIGNPPTAFSADDYLYHFTLRLNRATATNLNEGGWLFNNQGKHFLTGLRQALEPQKILLVFCDFHEVKKSNPVLPFLGKTLQMPNGVLRLIEKETVPVYFAGFCRQPPGDYVLSLQRLSTQGTDPGASALGVQYLQALEAHVRRHPSAWQCWEMF